MASVAKKHDEEIEVTTDVESDLPENLEDEFGSLSADLISEPIPRDDQFRARPVPRITVHGFCESPETGVVLQRAGEDRRLSKAHVTVYMGGLKAAIEQYETSPTPNLIIIEKRSDGPSILEGLAQLAEVCDPTTKVIVVGAHNDIALYRELMRQGINDYLVTPLTPYQMVQSISSIYVDPQAAPVGRTIAFVGAKGGVGSSTIAHNVGWSIAEKLDDDATILDLDLPFGTASLDFNQDSGPGLVEALTAPERLDDVMLDRLLVKCSERLSLFTSPNALDREVDFEAESFELIIETVCQAVPNVIIDVPHMWVPWTQHVVLNADEVVVTASPDLACLRNAKNIIDTIRAARTNDSPPRLVLNQVGVQKRPEIPPKEFGEAVDLTPSLIVPFDGNLFATAANNGQMLGELNQQSKITESILDFASEVVGKDIPAAKKRSIWAKLGLINETKRK